MRSEDTDITIQDWIAESELENLQDDITELLEDPDVALEVMILIKNELGDRL